MYSWRINATYLIFENIRKKIKDLRYLLDQLPVVLTNYRSSFGSEKNFNGYDITIFKKEFECYG